MKNIVTSLYADYGRYIDAFRHIPKDIDVLKPVERRILLSVHQVARNKFEKSAKIIGTCIGNYHPHGDCLDGKTLIFTLDSGLQTIEDIYNSKVLSVPVLAVDKTNNIVKANAYNFRIGQFASTIYEIHFENGESIKCTGNHKINTLDGWIRADDLTINAKVVALNSFEDIDNFNDECFLRVIKIEINHESNPIPMYDFTVDNIQNMFVATGDVKRLSETKSLINVHNSSTYDSLISLVNRGFITGQGNWGKYGLDDSRAAAYRYTECKANNSLNNTFSDYLKFVPWENLELEKEPLYIPYPVPLGLIGSGFITGIGFHTTKIPRYKFKDLVNRLVEILENKQKTTIIPYVEDCAVYEEQAGEFEKILTSGQGKIQIVPNVTSTATEMIITGRNPLIGFNSLKKLNNKHEEENKVQLFNAIDLWDYKCKTTVYIQITTTSRSKLLDSKFKKTILTAISSKASIRVNVIENNNFVKLKSIDELLLLNYNKWKESILKYNKNLLSSYITREEEYNVIIAVRAIINANPNIKKIEDIIKLNNSKYTDDQIRFACSKHTIKTLIESHIDIVSIKSKISSLKQTISNIDKIVLDEVKTKFL